MLSTTAAPVASDSRTDKVQAMAIANPPSSPLATISAISRITLFGKRVFKRSDWHYIVILIVAFAAHGLVLLNDGVYWDGWLPYTSLKANDWNNVLGLFLPSGRPLFAFLIWGIGSLPGIPIAFRLTAFSALTLSAVLVYQIGLLTKFLNSRTCLFIALLGLAYPAYQVAIEITVGTLYLLCYLFFLLAVFFALRSEQAYGKTHWLLRIASLVLFVISFTTKSFLVFYFGFVFLWLFYVQRQGGFSLRFVPTFLFRRIDFVLLPFLYWVTAETFFPNHGLYVDYQKFDLRPEDMLASSYRFWENAIYGQITGALRPAILSLLVFLAVSFVILISRIRTSTEKFKSGQTFALTAFGILLLVLGALPYVAINASPSLHGWTTRHALLIALPVAIVIVAVLSPIYSNPNRVVSGLGLALMVTLAVAFCWSTVQNYVSWQSRWAKDRSIMLQLSKMNDAKRISIFWVDDKYPLGGEGNYRYYEWSSMFKTVWGGESWIGLDLTTVTPDFLQKSKPYFIGLFNLEQLDAAGCQAVMTIQRGPISDGDRKLALHYLWLKYFQPATLGAFLEQVTRLDIQLIPGQNSRKCATGAVENVMVGSDLAQNHEW